MKIRIGLLLLLFFCVMVLVTTNFGLHGTRVYDCRYSEISPDYPIEVKEECRKLRYEQWKQEQEEHNSKRVIRT